MASIEFISKKPYTFIVRGINAGIANAVRRSAEEIPVLAIDSVEFVKNDSALFDEVLAHRLGLIPLKSSKLQTREKCTCKGKGCAKCTIKLKLQAKADKGKMIYASSIKPSQAVYPKMPIVYLTQNQELQLNAEAVLGKGTEHAKFSPGLVYYRAHPILKIKAESKDSEIKCPRNVFSGNQANEIECDLCMACSEQVNVTPSEEDFIFTIESFGQLSEKEIFKEALQVLERNLSQLKKVK